MKLVDRLPSVSSIEDTLHNHRLYRFYLQTHEVAVPLLMSDACKSQKAQLSFILFSSWTSFFPPTIFCGLLLDDHPNRLNFSKFLASTCRIVIGDISPWRSDIKQEKHVSSLFEKGFTNWLYCLELNEPMLFNNIGWMAYLLIKHTHSKLIHTELIQVSWKDKVKCYLKTVFHARTLCERELALVTDGSHLCSSFV